MDYKALEIENKILKCENAEIKMNFDVLKCSYDEAIKKNEVSANENHGIGRLELNMGEMEGINGINQVYILKEIKRGLGSQYQNPLNKNVIFKKETHQLSSNTKTNNSNSFAPFKLMNGNFNY